MTRIDTLSILPQFAPHIPSERRPDVRAMLRDIAYVLHATQKIKMEILDERVLRRAKPALELVVAD